MEKRVTATEVERLAEARRREPKEVELHELKRGDLFMCNLGAHEGYLYKFVKSVYVAGREPNTGVLDHCLATEVMHCDQSMRQRDLEPSNWNPYCRVYKVRVIFFPE